MRKHTAAGIDIGTHDVKVVIAESDLQSDKALPRVVGLGSAESKGVRHGYIVSSREAAKGVMQAVAAAERSSGAKIRKAVISIGGVSLQSVVGVGSAVISRGDSEVTDMDIDKAAAAAERSIPTSQMANRRVIHTIPLTFKIDGKPVLGRPQGMKGNKLEARVLFVTCLAQHLDDVIDAVSDAGIEVVDVVASPIAASLVSLSKNQKVAGCVLANIGAETLSLVVYENNLPVSLEVFPIGSTDVTNDIALGLKIPIEDAEALKRGGAPATIQFSKKKLDEIVEARLSDIFDLVESHLKKIDRNGLLPAGIILTGGGSGIAGIADMAKDALRLPARASSARESSIAVAHGAAMIGLSGDDFSEGSMGKAGAAAWQKTLGWFKQFLP